jgi:hypothetical protein
MTSPHGNSHDPFAVDEGRTLDVLTLAWGDSYHISISDDLWQARHHDARDQHALTGHTPDELNRAIRADYTRRQAANPAP